MHIQILQLEVIRLLRDCTVDYILSNRYKRGAVHKAKRMFAKIRASLLSWCDILFGTSEQHGELLETYEDISNRVQQAEKTG